MPGPTAVQRFRVSLAAAIAAAAIVTGGCDGGGGGGGSAPAGPQGSGVDPASVAAAQVEPQSDADAARFLTQSTFGATSEGITRVRSYKYSGWLEDQFAMPGTGTHRETLEAMAAALPSGQSLGDQHLMYSFWSQSVRAPDEMRRRVAFALSQIFVISLQDANVAEYKRGVASYLDMLTARAFGNYRDLLEGVARHPMMGLYLSHLRNQKASTDGSRQPDQNFAREIMQLFSIGLYRVNADGTVYIDPATGKPVETYTTDDIIGLSHVFTGFSWAGPDKANGRFFGNSTPAPDPNRDVLPMQSYPSFHSTAQKRFLGTTIAAQTAPDPEASLRIALDTIAAHPNVGPFMARALIQRLVTSNPSAAYVGRVAQAFNTGRYTSGAYVVGSGARGDLKATVAAILLDSEARGSASLADPRGGRLREPILRVTAWMRAFNARSSSGGWLLGTTDDPATQLAQSPMRSPSVFNFYRPGYVPPNTAFATADLVAPEFQIVHETSVAGYSNFMNSAVRSGLGASSGGVRDILPDYTAEIALADNPDALIERINLLLANGTMSTDTKGLMRAAITSVTIPTNNATNADTARRNRVYLAVLFGVSAPEFLSQR